MLKMFQTPLVQPTYNIGPYLYSATRHKQFLKQMSPKFNSERVVCPDKYFLTLCFFFQVESSRFSKQQNKLVLTLNSFRNGALFDISRRQVSKTAEHARAVPAINVTKWRTTNKVLPRSLASRQSARGELLVKSMGSVKRTTLLVCLGVCSEKSVVIIHMIIPFILLLLVKMFATTRRRSGLSFSC